MPHTNGLRGRTRHLFAKAFRHKGMRGLSHKMKVYKMGDYVDIIADGSIQKGMPHKFYHGKTGRIFNITKQGCGVVCNKKVGNRIIPKRINIKFDHIRPSANREAFKERVRENERIKAEARKNGTFVQVKREPGLPRVSHVIKDDTVTLNPTRFRYVF